LPMFRYTDGRKVRYFKQAAANVLLFLISICAVILILGSFVAAVQNHQMSSGVALISKTRSLFPPEIFFFAVVFGAGIAIFWGLARYAEEKIARQSKGSAAQ
jgi:hypothetical protein